MWRLLGMAFMVAGLLGCGAATSSEQPTGTMNVSFRVDGMMCEHSCAKTVHEILAAQPGVQQVVVNYEQKQATCQIDPRSFAAENAIAELADQDFVATIK